MKKLFVILLFVLLLSSPAMSEESICDGAGLKGRLFWQCKGLCERSACMSEDSLFTSKWCILQFERYIRRSGGEMPPCIVRAPHDEVPDVINELYCYANRRLDSIEHCDPLFDSSIDNYESVNLSDGQSEYELCIMNAEAVFDMCITYIGIQCWDMCSDRYASHCILDWEQTQDSTEYTACVAEVQSDIDACVDNECDHGYFYSSPDSDLNN